jgi:hypothetical protein
MTTTTLTTICKFQIDPWELGWAMGFLANGHVLMVTMVTIVTWCAL